MADGKPFTGDFEAVLAQRLQSKSSSSKQVIPSQFGMALETNEQGARPREKCLSWGRLPPPAPPLTKGVYDHAHRLGTRTTTNTKKHGKPPSKHSATANGENPKRNLTRKPNILKSTKKNTTSTRFAGVYNRNGAGGQTKSPVSTTVSRAV